MSDRPLDLEAALLEWDRFAGVALQPDDASELTEKDLAARRTFHKVVLLAIRQLIAEEGESAVIFAVQHLAELHGRCVGTMHTAMCPSCLEHAIGDVTNMVMGGMVLQIGDASKPAGMVQ